MNGSSGDEGGAIEPTVIFIHIGKTAGSTLQQVIRRNYPARAILRAQRPGGPREATLEDMARIPLELRRAARLVMGHTVFGIHELLPGPSTYITVVRDPMKLVVSQYRFVIRRPRHRFHRQVTSSDMELADYIRSGMSLEVDNGQVRAIAGDTSTPFGECTEEMLRTARRNIDRHFAAVGLTERFDETLLLFREALGWSHLCYVPANVAPDVRPRGSDLTPEARSLIERHTALDRELYDFVRGRFGESIAAIPRFEERLRRFRALNRLYRHWGSLVYSAPRRMRLAVRGRGRDTARPIGT